MSDEQPKCQRCGWDHMPSDHPLPGEAESEFAPSAGYARLIERWTAYRAELTNALRSARAMDDYYEAIRCEAKLETLTPCINELEREAHNADISDRR